MTLQIKQHDPYTDHPNLFVAAPTGDYNELDVLECYHKDTPDLGYCMAQAQNIKFGDAIYRQDTPLSPLQIDAMLRGVTPDEVVNNEKLIARVAADVTPIVGKMYDRHGLIVESSHAVEASKKPAMTIDDYLEKLDKIDGEVTVPTPTPETATSTPQAPEATSTPILEPQPTSTTTPEIIPTIDPTDPVATTTPIVEIPTSTTTPEIIPPSNATTSDPSSFFTSSSTPDASSQ